MASSCVLRIWLNAQQIVQWQWVWDARQISRQSTIPIAHFPFPFFQRLTTIGSQLCSCPETDAMSYHSGSRSHRSLKNAQIQFFAIPEVWLPTKGLRRFQNPFSSLCRGLHAGKAIRPHLYSHFSNLRALGLPMCNIFTVSGSSLPVPIFIGRWIDHINLQAEVMKSGMKMFPHMVGYEWQRWISGNFIKSV